MVQKGPLSNSAIDARAKKENTSIRLLLKSLARIKSSPQLGRKFLGKRVADEHKGAVEDQRKKKVHKTSEEEGEEAKQLLPF